MFTVGTSSDVLRNLTLQEAIELVSKTGFDVIELWMGHITSSPLSIDEIRTLLKHNNLLYQIHADVRDVNLTSINTGIRRESIRQTLGTIEFAKELGAELIILHPGRMSSTKDKPEDMWPIQIEVFKEIATYGEQLGIKIGLENMEKRPKEFVMTNEAIHRLINEVNNPYLGMTLDLAHCHSLGDVSTYVKSINVPIYNVHISQASKGKMHLPFSTTKEDRVHFENVLPLLYEKYDGVLVNESYEHGNEVATLIDAHYSINKLIHTFQEKTSQDPFNTN
ncbi:sugar phosphate isomerase/epimerase family protein [Oceanobacillus rekensis]|uniref:sugar phosphate isomerase/epimerase family protein n=1 Tax=Oceanobacillus rekensis TaxID=937927 RepID=UPI000B454089|nr:sugar phosphate isomerase/epimerase family protein [Oceanobacillus rekensis]